MAERLDTAPSPGPDCGDVHFALGKMYDDLGEYDLAFDHFRRGNEVLKRHTPFDPGEPDRRVEYTAARYDEGWFDRVRGWGDPSERPVFIVGMPRSGTTLVEQILASHPEVHGAGELIRIPNLAQGFAAGGGGPQPDAAAPDRSRLEAAAKDYLGYLGVRGDRATRVTDKLPENFHHLGFIASILPNARIVHVRRCPMDVCVSNYVARFQRGHAYSYDLDSLAAEYHAYERLMRHWRAVLPSPVLELAYESLVESLELPEPRAGRFLRNRLGRPVSRLPSHPPSRAYRERLAGTPAHLPELGRALAELRVPPRAASRGAPPPGDHRLAQL